MKCDTCLHKNVCRHYADIRSETYAYMGIRFDPENDCKEYVNSDLKGKGATQILSEMNTPSSEKARKWAQKLKDNFEQQKFK